MKILSARWGDTNHTRLELETDGGHLSITEWPHAAIWKDVTQNMVIAPYCTILSAQYANANNTAVRIVTQEIGGVIASQEDTPALWQELLDSGAEVAPYQVPVEQN